MKSITAVITASVLWAVMLAVPFMTGCNGTTVAQDIVNWTPALQSAVATVDSSIATLDPAVAPIVDVATVGFDAGTNLLVAVAKDYLANPNATTLGKLQNAVVALEQQVSSALLSAAKITNPATQKFVLNAINAVATIVLAILALVQSVSSKVAVARMAQDSKIKLAQVEPYLNRNMVEESDQVNAHYGYGWARSMALVFSNEDNLQQAGF